MYISLEKASSTPQHRQQPTAHVTNTDTRYNASQSIVTHTRLCTQQLKHKEVLTPPGIDRHIHTSFPGNSTTHLFSVHTHQTCHTHIHCHSDTIQKHTQIAPPTSFLHDNAQLYHHSIALIHPHQTSPHTQTASTHSPHSTHATCTFLPSPVNQSHNNTHTGPSTRHSNNAMQHTQSHPPTHTSVQHTHIMASATA